MNIKLIKEQKEILIQNKDSSDKLYKMAIDNGLECSIIFFISSVFMEMVLEDIEYVVNLMKSKERERYINLILRVTVEQVIIYRNLMNSNSDNIEMCKDFLGNNIDIEQIKIGDQSEYEKLKCLIGDRTKMYKNKFYKMATTFENPDEDCSFYKMYALLADYVHNAYYQECKKLLFEDETEFKDFAIYIFGILININEEYFNVMERYTEDAPLD